MRGYADGSAQSDDTASKKSTKGTSYVGHYYAVYVKGATLAADEGSNGQVLLANATTNESHYHSCGGLPVLRK